MSASRNQTALTDGAESPPFELTRGMTPPESCPEDTPGLGHIAAGLRGQHQARPLTHCHQPQEQHSWQSQHCLRKTGLKSVTEKDKHNTKLCLQLANSMEDEPVPELCLSLSQNNHRNAVNLVKQTDSIIILCTAVCPYAQLQNERMGWHRPWICSKIFSHKWEANATKKQEMTVVGSLCSHNSLHY